MLRSVELHPPRDLLGGPDRDPTLACLGDPATAVGRVLDAAAGLGLSDLFFMIGVLDDREDHALPWPDQLAAVAGFLADLRPRLRDLDLRLLLKTHEEISSFEAARLVEKVGPDRLGIAFDPVNVLVRLEEPTAAARRLAPYVAQVHLDDATLAMDGRLVRRHLALLGDGVLDWPEMLGLLSPVPRLIDLLRGQFALPALDPAFQRAQPDLAAGELAWIIVTARRGPAVPPPGQMATSERLSRALDFARHSGGRA